MSESQNDLRSETRALTFQKGTLFALDGATLEHVTIQNMSNAGARLFVQSGWQVPDDVVLEIPARHQRRLSKVRWRLSAAVGLMFVDRPQRAPRHSAPEIGVRLIELEREVNRLSAQNRQLLRELSIYRAFEFVQ